MTDYYPSSKNSKKVDGLNEGNKVPLYCIMYLLKKLIICFKTLFEKIYLLKI